MASGFFLGGASQGFSQAREAGIQQQQADQQGDFNTKRLQLQQKEMENQQHRELFARSDKARTELMDTIKQTISAAQSQAVIDGKPFDTDKLSKSLMPLAQMAAKNAALAGVPNGSDSVMAQFTAMLAIAKAATTDPQAAAIASKRKPGSSPLAAGDVPQQPVNVADAGGTPMPPGQNLTGPASTVTDVSYGPVEQHGTSAVQPASPSASPPSQTTILPQPGVGYDVTRLQRILSVLPKDDPRRAVYQEQYREALRIQSERPQLHTIQSLDGTQKLVSVDRNGVQHDVVDTSMDGIQKQRVEKAYQDDLHGIQFLKALPAKDSQYVKGIATYKINPTTSSIRGGRRETVMNWVMQYNPEYDQTVFTSKNRALSVLGQRVGQINGAIENAVATAPRVLETSELVDRTKFKSLNQLLLTADEQIGDPNVVRFKTAVLTLVNNYSRALGAGTATLTDSARKEAMDILQTAYSKGQIKAAVSQMLIEMKSELTGSKNALDSTRSIYGDDSATGAKPQDTSGKNSPDTSGKLPPPPPGAVIVH